MPKATPVTPAQIAQYGHIAAALRAWMQQSGKTISDINKGLGKPSTYTSAYHWLSGKGAPGPAARAKLVKLTGIPVASLTARKPGQKALPAPTAMTVTVPRSAPATRAADVLSFAVTTDGEARIRLDVVLPLDVATPLLRMILDAGVVLGARP